MLALSIRQPYAELILRGMKTIEYRSRSTRIIGERFFIYASKQWAGGTTQKQGRRKGDGLKLDDGIHSDDLVVDAPPPWMVELANGLRLFPRELPTGVIVGTAVIEKVTSRDDGMFQWHLSEVERAKQLRKPTGRPQPVWFRAF